MEEYIGVHALAPGAWLSPQPTKVFSGGFPAVVMNPAFKELKFKSGDVLVSYGMAYGSAAIAHVGEDGGTFSHMALIYVDEATGKTYTIEAHPEFGVKVAELEKYLNDGKGRSALFRFHDSEIAALGAKLMFDIALKADSSGHTIPYDFAMDLDDHTKLFCTEVVKYAFDLGAKKLGREVVVPTFMTKITMRNTYILDAFGIKARMAFAPSDIEVDPNFEMLAEWRDLARVRLMHHQQAALQMEFKWLDDLDYNYRSDAKTMLEARLLWAARHLPMFEGMVANMVPPDLSRKTLEAVANVYVVSDQIHGHLIEMDSHLEATTGMLMTAAEIRRSIEAYRVDDMNAYRTYQLWLKYDRYSSESTPPSSYQFHWLLRARKDPQL